MLTELVVFWFATAIIIALAFIVIVNNIVRKKFLLLLLLFIIIFSYGFYWYYGSYKLLPEYYSDNTKTALQQYTKLRPMLQDLRKKSFRIKVQIEKNPKKAQLWRELAVTYILLRKVDEGVKAFKRAYKLDPYNRDIAFTYVKALNMLAITAYQAEDYKKALATWNLLEQEVAANNFLDQKEISKLRKLLMPLRDKARNRIK